MKIEVHKAYRDECGRTVYIMGRTKPNPEWLWSVMGEWYDEATGRVVISRIVKSGEGDEKIIHHHVAQYDSTFNLIAELPEEQGWFEGL